jgi:hypothetical protein
MVLVENEPLKTDSKGLDREPIILGTLDVEEPKATV